MAKKLHWKQRGRICVNCNSKLERSLECDAKFCRACNVWAESICSDEGCNFCKIRPDTPKTIKASDFDEAFENGDVVNHLNLKPRNYNEQ